MASVDIFRLQETFYVPIFQVKLRGQDLPEDVVRDVMQVTYRDNVKEIDSFELQVGNWDGDKRKPKYEPFSDPKFRGVFDPGQTIELYMGYMRNTRLMMTGEITTLEPNYPTAGGLTLGVRGLNILHRFRTEQHTYGWFGKRDSDIAHELGQRPLRRGHPGLGVRVEIDPAKEEVPQASVFMDNQYDIVFLIERARRHGYEVVLIEEKRDRRTEQFLYFGPSSSRLTPPTYRLEWGKSLLSFRPTLSTARQISAVTVRGWDRRRNREISVTASLGEQLPRASLERQRLQNVAQAFDNRTEIVTDRPVHTEAEARSLAHALLRDQLNQMVTAIGSTVGLPDLRAGRKIEIVGLGERFDGEYYVTDTTHQIGDGGYTTEFSARRLLVPPGK